MLLQSSDSATLSLSLCLLSPLLCVTRFPDARSSLVRNETKETTTNKQSEREKKNGQPISPSCRRQERCCCRRSPRRLRRSASPRTPPRGVAGDREPRVEGRDLFASGAALALSRFLLTGSAFPWNKVEGTTRLALLTARRALEERAHRDPSYGGEASRARVQRPRDLDETADTVSVARGLGSCVTAGEEVREGKEGKGRRGGGDRPSVKRRKAASNETRGTMTLRDMPHE